MGIYTTAIMLVLGIGMVVYALWPSRTDEDDAVKRRMRGKTNKSNQPDARQVAKESVAKRMMKSVAPIAVRPVMLNKPEEISKLRMRLATAGLRSDNATTTFLASKTIVAIGLGLMGLLYAFAKGGSGSGAFGWALLGAGLGFLAPNLWLGMAISKRKEQVRRGLPDTLDLMVISVESGLAFDSALQRVSDEMQRVHPALAEELQIVTLESQMGIPRSEALSNFVARTELDEVKSLVAVINQAERFGASVSRALRNQSDSMRTRRRQEAEERAQKTTVKLMAPLILFIFPAIMVVLAGPAALKMIDTLGNTPGLF